MYVEILVFRAIFPLSGKCILIHPLYDPVSEIIYALRQFSRNTGLLVHQFANEFIHPGGHCVRIIQQTR